MTTHNNAVRWIRSAQNDLDAARMLLDDQYFHLCAFHSQQAAEKALKGVLVSHGERAWGHRCLHLLEQCQSLIPESSQADDLVDRVIRLDEHYTPSRYPDALPNGVPADHYDIATAEQALDDASVVLSYVQAWLS